MTEDDTFDALRKWEFSEISEYINNHCDIAIGYRRLYMHGSEVAEFAVNFIKTRGWTVDDYVSQYIKRNFCPPWWRAYQEDD